MQEEAGTDQQALNRMLGRRVFLLEDCLQLPVRLQSSDQGDYSSSQEDVRGRKQG